MIEFDTSRHPGRPSEWAALVEAICASAEPVESVWLECKTVNWGASPSVGNVARAILGMANRSVSDAAPFLGGSGIVLVGFNDREKTIQDQAMLDPTDVENKLAPYVGSSDGPRWRPEWLKVDGKPLLLIEVDAPRSGDPEYTLRQGFGDYKMSQTFVRMGSKTVAATQDQVNELARRFTAAASEESLDVDVTFELDDPLSKVLSDDQTVEAWLAEEEERLLATLAANPKHVAPSVDLGRSIFAQIASANSFMRDEPKEEERTKDEFRSQVTKYIHGARATMTEALESVAQNVLTAPRFYLSNKVRRNYSDVKVTIRVEGEARAADVKHDDLVSIRQYLPKPPRKFGAYFEPSAFSIIAASGAGRYSPVLFPVNHKASRRQIRNGGSFEVDFEGYDLRPDEKDHLLESRLVVIVPTTRAEPVIVHWTATASNINDVAEGQFELPFAGETIDLLRVKRKNE